MFSKSSVWALFVLTVAVAAVDSNCTASSLVVSSVSYAYRTDILHGHASLHWILTDGGSVDCAVERSGTGGWLGVGFRDPESDNEMVGAHAIVANGSDTMFLHLDSFTPPFPTITPSDMRVAFDGAVSVMQGGNTILTLSGANLSLSNFSFIAAYHDDCTWPCQHAMESYHELNLLESGMDMNSENEEDGGEGGHDGMLVIGSTSYVHNMTVLDGEASLHWVVTDEGSGTVELALVNMGDGGWLSLGMPVAHDEMVDAHAIVADASGVQFLHLTSHTPPFPPMSRTDMRVELASASSLVQAGKRILTVSGAKVPLALGSLELIFGLNSGCVFPCQHSVEGAEKMNFTTPISTTVVATSSSTASGVTTSTAHAAGAARKRESAGLVAAGAISFFCMSRV